MYTSKSMARRWSNGRKRDARVEFHVESSESHDVNDVDSSRDARFTALVKACGEFMQLNNDNLFPGIPGIGRTRVQIDVG